jgi:DeoR/GlpR family transcriptional regulator of sugar metabolism
MFGEKYFRIEKICYNISRGVYVMLAIERRQKISEIILEKKSVKVPELSQLFDVTEETIRRDLEKLEKKGILMRTYGGAILCDSTTEDPPFTVRVTKNKLGKQKIAKKVAEWIQDGETIMLDSSSTALEVAKNIKDKRNLTVITNSIHVIMEFSQIEHCNVISTGGLLKPASMSFVGSVAENTISNYYVNKAILSCKGIDKSIGIMESNEMEKEIKKIMAKSAQNVYLVVDHTKFDKVAFVKMFEIDEIDILFTEDKLSEDWEEILRNKNIHLEYCY